MSSTDTTHHIIATTNAMTMANRPNNRDVAVPRDLPGIVIFIHGVNDPGETYEFVEKGLCQGLSERLSRGGDLTPGVYGAQYHAASQNKDPQSWDGNTLYDPDTYLYKRSNADNTKSVFIPFYWGYRASSNEIAKISTDPSVARNQSADKDGNLLMRGQYQDKQGNRLDAHFGKQGGFFSNATNNIPDMYGAGFKAPTAGKVVTYTGLAGNYTYIADAPERRYFVLAAERLATLISTIRNITPSAAAVAAGMHPIHDTITIMGHSQGTIITLLAQALLVKRGERCADCLIMVDSPYSLYTTDGSKQTGRAKLKTLVDIVNAVTSKPYDLPALADLLITQDKHGGRTGSGWTPAQGKRLDKNGKDWITFDERDNRGKVYLYFCPEDTTVALSSIRGIGTFGVPDTVQDPNQKSPLAAMIELKGKRFFQRMWTRLTQSHGLGTDYKPVLVGTAPARMPIRDNLERLTVGPDSGAGLLVSAATQVSHKRGDIRDINGEELKPPYAPDLYGGEVVRGGSRPGYADQAGKFTPDAVSMDTALGNHNASLQWKTVDHTLLPPNVDQYKKAFNEPNAGDVNAQSQNWRVTQTLIGYTVEREETPNEARQRMGTDPSAQSDNSYHSGILHSAENHRWVTAMDVAIGQAVSLDDPFWRDLLIRMADWRLDRKALTKIQGNQNYGRLSAQAQKLIEQSARYYQKGVFPDESVVSTTGAHAIPPLVTNELQIDGGTNAQARGMMV